MQTAIPCTMMRGGTSRGPYFLANHLPADWASQEQVLLAALGSASAQQIDGIGGGTSLSSKAAIVSISKHPDADIDYLFAQVSVDDMSVDISPSCGNIMSGVAPFAIESGLVRAEEGVTQVMIRNVNTDSLIEIVVQTPGGQVEYEGDTAIDGVEGTGAPVLLNFLDVAGTKTGKLFPTGNLRDSFDGVEVSCVDAAVPMVLIPATSLGKSGQEGKDELDSDEDLLARIEKIRRAAAWKMGLGDVSDKVLPKVSLLSAPEQGGTITSRYFVPYNCHASHAVTGAICVSTAVMVEGTVTDELVKRPEGDKPQIKIEHPSGKIDIVLETSGSGAETLVDKAGLVRTARKLFRGELYVPRDPVIKSLA
ncbi:MAG: 4-oxalomesaconate tautomerase [Motiliproteus sp.]|nr:4-oxalomesaconate tautomerase [Motiliproteus sp.]